jgi:Zn-dependent protease
MEAIVGIIILIFSVIIHEVMHGVVANALGDPTAKYAGRLTLNPISHIDPVGSVIVPILSYVTGGFIFGWAKPVPYNPYNLRDKEWGELWVALAGPASNIALALIFGLTVRFLPLSQSIATILSLGTLINLGLAIFNLVPIPPLDGSKILFAFLPLHMMRIRYALEQWGFMLVVLFIVVFGKLLSPVVALLFHLITGLTL